jgi:lipopolysaccharide/colanic/teichoic acid biosynthesis glycosyltransferase
MFDLAGATLLLVLATPLLLAGIALVYVAGGRPVFFGHRRVGRGGRPFRCWKLRTMTVDAEAALDEDPALLERHRELGFKLPDAEDPRVTGWGRWLRQTYVDEIPQLFNVLGGSMSLVGPRPVVAEELELYGTGRDLLLAVKPGVFGAWSSLGRARPPYPERARVELDYLRERTAWVDARILMRSLWAVLQGQGDE